MPDKSFSSARKLALVLVVTGILLSLLRLLVTVDDPDSVTDQAWTLTQSLQVTSYEADSTVRMQSPWDSRHARLYAQTLKHPGLRLKRLKNQNKNRELVFVAADAGNYEITGTYEIYITERDMPLGVKPLTDSSLASYLAEQEHLPVNDQMILALTPERPVAEGDTNTSNDERNDTQDTLPADARDEQNNAGPAGTRLAGIDLPGQLDTLFAQVSGKLRVTDKGHDDVLEALANGTASTTGFTRSLVSVLRSAGIPARQVYGIDLLASSQDQPFQWLEYYDGNQWQVLDPLTGTHGLQRPELIPLRKNAAELVSFQRASLHSINWQMEPSLVPAEMQQDHASGLIKSLDLTRLPLESREALGILLLLPFGALVTVLLRQIAGFRTFGTFTPTLLALAAVFVDIRAAAASFILVITIGIAGRSLLPLKQLDNVPRLSIVFTFVALTMAFVVSLLVQLDPSMDTGVVLLPIVILTTLVDQIYKVYDSSGPRATFIRLSWTSLAAALSLAVLMQAHWGELLLATPEVHFFTLAVIIMAGTWRGKTLATLRALAWMKEPSSSKSKQTEDAD